MAIDSTNPSTDPATEPNGHHVPTDAEVNTSTMFAALSSSIRSAFDDGVGRVTELAMRALKLAKSIESTVGKRPMLAAAGALVAGAVLGLIIARSFTRAKSPNGQEESASRS